MSVAGAVERAAAVAAALDALAAGRPVGVPTDTVYGLAAAASDEQAVERLFRLKQRPAERSIAVIVADTAAAAQLVEFDGSAGRLAERFWPGPLTIVATRTPSAPVHLGKGSTIGVRLPDDAIMQAIAAPRPLAVTSANLHGSPTPTTAQGVADLLPDLGLVIDGGARGVASSTVVDVTGPVPEILREGPVSLEEISEAVAESPG
ncbi:MAG: L-threonylcarbamoyladenylate synthase [Acidimicrobiaceae bacterium]|nr:L-threonylcarbamoyladenylate synthase [Acidimicrobiaceae bacterium]MCY4175263.1 L-threonylcarbamoyladenylate synthase [Acidimicrobiaceae bacterium]MCY4280999.1 L-threonylcarbamoyladenylate synthase [Acidimicrobiaceae bacterium]MCY4295322.1 L-threonylcarbamoyladenylate synthase [Acidimicrobiaceae bacterium]